MRLRRCGCRYSPDTRTTATRPTTSTNVSGYTELCFAPATEHGVVRVGSSNYRPNKGTYRGFHHRGDGSHRRQGGRSDAACRQRDRESRRGFGSVCGGDHIRDPSPAINIHTNTAKHLQPRIPSHCLCIFAGHSRSIWILCYPVLSRLPGHLAPL